MKNYRSIFSLIIVCFVLISCKKNSSSPQDDFPVDLKGPYIAMKVDGKWWVAEGNKLSKGSIELMSYPFSEKGTYVLLIGSEKSSNNFVSAQETFRISFNLKEAVKVRRYSLPLEAGDYSDPFQIDLGQWVAQGDGGSQLVSYASNNSYDKTGLPFEVHISRTAVDINNPGIIYLSGTFSGQLRKADGSVVYITEGKFALD